VPDPDCEPEYFCEIAWRNQEYSLITTEKDDNGCTTNRIDLDGGKIESGTNQGRVGEDPTGLAWAFQEGSPTVCQFTGCGPTDGLQVQNGAAALPGQPNDYRHRIIYVSCLQDGYQHFFSGTGVVTGYGDTQQEALDNARALLS